MKKINKKISQSQKVSIGFAVTTVVATAVGAYFLYGAKNAARNRKTVRGWMLKAKGEVLEGVEKLNHLNKESYHDLIDRVIKRYMKMKTVSNKEARALQMELKSHWKHLQNMAAKQTRKAVKKKAPKKKATPKRKTSQKKKK